MERSKEEVARTIEDFLNGRGDAWDWDDFTSIRIDDSELERIRWLCGSMRDIYPPEEPGDFCGPEGVAALRRILDGLR